MVTLVVIIGTLMTDIEGDAGGFRSIPIGICRAIVTITMVGDGDGAPVAPPGRVAASAAMLLGHSILAVPTGSITAELGEAGRRHAAERPGLTCGSCGELRHLEQARRCSQRLRPAARSSDPPGGCPPAVPPRGCRWGW